MKYFKDFEFNEDGITIDPISLGIVTETGAELYIEFDYDEAKVAKNEWVMKNVIPLLTKPKDERLSFEEARIEIYNFISTDPSPEFWAYYADYDWVCFCRMWGKMIDLPEHFPRHCKDLKQLYDHLGRPPIARPPAPTEEHNALVDARWNRHFFRNMRPLAERIGLVL